MEVMSSLLLCALVALLPQGLGKKTEKSSNTDVKFNSSIMIEQNAYWPHKLLINLNEPILLRANEHKTKSVYNDYACKKCRPCMNRAVKSFASRHRLNSQDLHYELLTNEFYHRIKRDVDSSNTTEYKANNDRKPKSKKNKLNKTVTVTKYNLDGVVTALKVKETIAASLTDNSTGKPSVATCEVYSVKKSFPCNSAEGDLMIKLSKSKTGKKGKREKGRNPEITTEQAKEYSPMYRKREVDNSQMPENVMSSVEDFY